MLCDLCGKPCPEWAPVDGVRTCYECSFKHPDTRRAWAAVMPLLMLRPDAEPEPEAESDDSDAPKRGPGRPRKSEA